jgi:small subunit ribosomal protein S1
MEEHTQPGDAESPENQDEDFAQLLEQSGETAELSAGAKVTGVIILIGDNDSFVDCGGRSELPIATVELQDEAGNLQYQVGDQLTAHVQEVGEELRLTLSLDLRDGDLTALLQAQQDGTPVTGTVRETNKGGLSVDLAGRRAFCPYSQIELRRVDNAEQYVGRSFSFRILEMSEDGRNIVLSRRALLQEERDQIAQETRASLALGDVREGVVTRLAPFGAFVDIGGIEGLVHISQISYARVDEPSSILEVGQAVKVKVLEIQNLGGGRRERISLSMKALAEDPWPATARALKVGEEVPGKVVRLADFGAFVELQPGVQGLIHISELAPHRIQHPDEVVRVGEEVRVRVLDVDTARRRISLSLKEIVQNDPGE